jgi:uncharacterized membrane protein required for colicin V production
MVFSIVVILLVGVITFFHYVQGFFSATLSAFSAIIAAVLAVSYHETVVNLLLKGKMADFAHGMVLCMLFIIIYSILRIIFDAAIPGNVRTPNVVDKVGAGLMGIVAGIFATGIFAIAAQTLPFDPLMSFMGYGRQAMIDGRKIILPQGGGRPSLDTQVGPALVDHTLEPDKEKGLLLPVDDLVMATVYHLSDGGSLAGDRPMATIHPDYLEELFGERLGIQTGARRVALALGGNDPVNVQAAFSAPSMPVADNEPSDLRSPDYKPAYTKQVKPTQGQELIIIRVKVNSSATDDDDAMFRFSPGSIHLVGPSRDGTFKDYYPIGTVENGNTILLDSPDDFLFVKTGDEFDAAFLVDESLLKGSGKNSNVFVDGVFLSVKRFGLVDLAGTEVKSPYVGEAGVKMARNQYVLQELKLPPPNYSSAPAVASNQPVSNGGGAPQNPSTPQPTPVTPVTPSDNATAPPQPVAGKEISSVDLDAKVSSGILAPGSISIGTIAADQEAKDAPVAGGKISLTGGQISAATIDPTATITKLGEGASAYQQFFVPQDKAMVQVQLQPYSSDWTDLMSQYGKTSLVDSNGNTYSPNGVYALAKGADGRGLFLRYDCQHVVKLQPPDAPMDGTVYLIFLVPTSTDIKSLKMGDKTQNLSAVLHVQ